MLSTPHRRLAAYLLVVAVATGGAIRGEGARHQIAHETHRATQRADRADRVSETNRRAICTLRVDLERRIKGSREFLHDHPQGIPGIPALLIKKGISDQTRTIHALQAVACPQAAPPVTSRHSRKYPYRAAPKKLLP